jgi:hypothetical protein
MSNSHRVSANQRRQMIAEAAYFRAERRGFRGGDPLKDWFEAEAEVDAQLQEIEHEHLLERLDETVAEASKRLAALRKKVGKLTASARTEWHDDVDKLAALRDGLRSRASELREHGNAAGHKLRAQAEKLRDEVAELLQRFASRSRH